MTQPATATANQAMASISPTDAHRDTSVCREFVFKANALERVRSIAIVSSEARCFGIRAPII